MVAVSAQRLPRTVWALGVVSLFMDASSELVHSLLPLYLAGSLGASMSTIGVLEGLAEAVAQIVKVFSGALSDYFGKRKLLTLLGYGLAALSKPIFPLASSVSWVFGARVIDRFGKGIRGAPRDAMIADVTSPEMRGAAFGLRQSLDSVGAFIGPLLAIALMAISANDFKFALWCAAIPAVLSVLVLLFAVDEPTNVTPTAKKLQWREVRKFPRAYWMVVLLGSVFTLARFSEAFLVLRGQQLGLGLTLAPTILVVLGATYALSAYPAGHTADRMPPTRLLVAGLVVLIMSDVTFAYAETATSVLIGAGLWGIHLGLTQGLFSKLVADTAPAKFIGTGFGVFNLLSGAALLIASSLAGWLWDTVGPARSFEMGATFAAITAIGLMLTRSGPRAR